MKHINKALQIVVWAVLIACQAAHAQTLDDLLKAVEEGDIKRTAFYLDRGLDPNSSDKDGNTILMIASRQGHADLASNLIARKASLTRQTRHGDTALLMASLGGHLDVVKLLVSAGAPVQGKQGWQPIHYAAFNGATDVVRYLLQHGAQKNALAPNSYTPLMLATRNGHAETVSALLSEGADVTQRGMNGETALDIALRRNEPALVDLLKRAGGAK
jgi:ankyrin repeat protein